MMHADFAVQTISQCLSPRLVSGSIFGGHSGGSGGLEPIHDPKDGGHFIVQPTGTFSQPMRRYAMRVLVRTSACFASFHSAFGLHRLAPLCHHLASSGF